VRSCRGWFRCDEIDKPVFFEVAEEEKNVAGACLRINLELGGKRRTEL
jgi:hypothetical protein